MLCVPRTGQSQVGDSHNSLQHLARDFIDGQGHKHADFPNFPVVLANCTPACKMGLGTWKGSA